MSLQPFIKRWRIHIRKIIFITKGFNAIWVAYNPVWRKNNKKTSRNNIRKCIFSKDTERCQIRVVCYRRGNHIKRNLPTVRELEVPSAESSGVSNKAKGYLTIDYIRTVWRVGSYAGGHSSRSNSISISISRLLVCDIGIKWARVGP